MEDWGKDDPSMYGILTTHVAGQMEQKVIPTVIGNYGKYYDNIYKALTEKAPLMVNPFDTVAVLKIIEAAMESKACFISSTLCLFSSFFSPLQLGIKSEGVTSFGACPFLAYNLLTIFTTSEFSTAKLYSSLHFPIGSNLS